MADEQAPSPFPPFMTPPTQPAAPGTAAPKPEKAPKAERASRRPRRAAQTTPETPKSSAKFDLQTILAAAQVLKEEDFPAFESIVCRLNDAGKPARDRILQAIGKVFG